MKYVIYIYTESNVYNIWAIEEVELQIIVEAYNIGKSSFFIDGKKYWLANLFEIKIFEIIKKKELEELLSETNIYLAIENDYVKLNDNNEPYLLPTNLYDFGNNVTNRFIKGDFGKSKIKTSMKKNECKIDIFISHSNADEHIAKSIIDIVKKAYNILPERIRCTSVPGYKLSIGANTEVQLKEEIFSSNVFVALITEKSVNSAYVLFELGARWGAELPLFPLICDRNGISLLAGPLSNINALNAYESSGMVQFIEDLGTVLDITPEKTSVYLRDIESFITTIK